MSVSLSNYVRCKDGFWRKKIALPNRAADGKLVWIKKFVMRWPDGTFYREQLQTQHTCPACVRVKTP